MSKQYLDKNGLQIVANKVKNKQDKFEVGTSLELVTVGEGEINEVLYADLGNVLTDELPSSAKTNITVNDSEKALSIANQLVQVQFFGFIDATMVSITALSPQTSVGATKGDTVTPAEPVTLLAYTNSVSREYNEWCSEHGVSFNIPWENNDTLTVYLSSPTLSISKTLNYKPDDTQLSDKRSWSSSHTRDVITSLLPLPLANSDTTTIEESSIPTWNSVNSVKQGDETVDTSPTIVDNYLLQKFLWNTTTGATELPKTMQVELNYREIYIGVYGYLISCNELVIGQTTDAPNEGSAIFENAVGMTWNYWHEGTYTVTFVNLSDCPVQKVNVTNAIDEEARETAAGAIGLAQQAMEKFNDVYSANEVKTNKIWLDGKPIYRKVLTLSSTVDNITQNTLKNISSNLVETTSDIRALNIDNITTIMKIGNNTTGYTFSLNSSNGVVSVVSNNENNVSLSEGFHILLEYTKTN